MTGSAPPGWRWERHGSLASTQDVAIAAAEAGDPGRLAILADVQSAGRGSRGRAWVSPAGNLNLSVVLRPDNPNLAPGRWALLAGLALYEALAPFAGDLPLSLKWPNDILLQGGKLGGILIDSAVGGSAGAPWVVIGLGANLAHAPEIEGRAVSRLPAPSPSAPDVALHVIAGLDRFVACDMAALIEAWLARAHPVGTMLDVQTPRQRLTGRFAGLTDRGELRLANHPTPIASAEIFPHQNMTGGLGGNARLPQCLPCS